MGDESAAHSEQGRAGVGAEVMGDVVERRAQHHWVQKLEEDTVARTQQGRLVVWPRV